MTKKQPFSRGKNEVVTHVTHVTRPEKVGDLLNMTNFSPALSLIGDDKDEPLPAFRTITIRWKAGTSMPTIHSKWKRLPDGRIEATYTADELSKCLELCDLLAKPDLEEM